MLKCKVENKIQAKSFAKGFSNSFGTPTSKPYLNKSDTPSKLAKYDGRPTRIAAMPIGMIKDLAEGGVVGMAKDLVPRAKNIVSGDSFINHAQ